MITLNIIPRSTPAAPSDTGVAQGGTTLNVQPATASAAAPSAPAQAFARTSRPAAADFDAIRAGLRSIVETTLVDLSVARSFALGNVLILPIQGTAWYIDKGADVGVATFHVQDQTFTPANTITVFPGDTINNIGFTLIAIENAAQAGKVLRIHYGTDIIFNPGLGGNVLFTGGFAGNIDLQTALTLAARGLIVTDGGMLPGTMFSSGTLNGALSGQSILVGASNPNGVLLLDSELITASAAVQQVNLQDAVTTPGNLFSGQTLHYAGALAGGIAHVRLIQRARLAAGRGLGYWTVAAELAPSFRKLAYTIL